MSFYMSVELYEILTLFSGKYMSSTVYAIYLSAKVFDRSGNKVQPWAKSPALQPISSTAPTGNFCQPENFKVCSSQLLLVNAVVS